jgi:hypothetical protein
VLLPHVCRMFQFNRTCPPWHTSSAYSKNVILHIFQECDIIGGDIKEVNQQGAHNCTQRHWSPPLLEALLYPAHSANSVDKLWNVK